MIRTEVEGLFRYLQGHRNANRITLRSKESCPLILLKTSLEDSNLMMTGIEYPVTVRITTTEDMVNPQVSLGAIPQGREKQKLQ